MRRFHSYGPVDKDIHFSVPRTDIVKQYLDQLIGHPEKGGHYFTVWAPRQTGKTWLTRQVVQEIEFDLVTVTVVAIGWTLAGTVQCCF